MDRQLEQAARLTFDELIVHATLVTQTAANLKKLAEAGTVDWRAIKEGVELCQALRPFFSGFTYHGDTIDWDNLPRLV